MFGRVLHGALACFAATVFVAACGGSPDTQAGPSTEALITDFCKKMAAVSCATPETQPQCLQALQTDQADAKQEGCEAELDRYLTCVDTKPIGCFTVDAEPHPKTADECDELRTVFGECYTRIPRECVVGLSGIDICTIKCPNLSSLCHGPNPNGPVDCVCDSGPRAGTAFQATDCGENLVWATGHTCQ